MLRKIANYSTKILIKRGMILEQDRNIYLYDFELFWSTLGCIIFIITTACVIGYIQQAIIFIMCYIFNTYIVSISISDSSERKSTASTTMWKLWNRKIKYC